MTFTVWARQDSVTANNSTLNPVVVGQAPAVQITFKPASPSGDAVPEAVTVSGVRVNDPDTLVTINGVDYPFTVLLTGSLPGNSQVPNGTGGTQNMVGRTVVLIRVVINGTPVEYFYVTGQPAATQLTMNDFGGGAIPLGTVNNNPQLCFVAGTDIAVPSGLRKVETLRAGDIVLTADGDAKQVMWVGKTLWPVAEMRGAPDLWPVTIPAHAFGPGAPAADLHVSPQHRVLISHPACELLFGEAEVLVPAKFLLGTMADTQEPVADVEYVHVLLADHDMLVSNGLATESFQPARRTLEGMGPSARVMLESVIETLGEEEMLTRKDSYLSLRQSEAKVLMQAMAQPRAVVAPASADRSLAH